MRAVQQSILCALMAVGAVAGGCGGGGGGGSPGLDPGQTAANFAPPPVNPPTQFDTGSRTIGSRYHNGLDIALPLYGLAAPSSALITAGDIFAGRRRNPDDSISLTFIAAPGQARSTLMRSVGATPFVGSDGDILYLEFGHVSPDVGPSSVRSAHLLYSRYGAMEFDQPSTQAFAFYGGFETPASAGPALGTLSYLGSTIVAETRGSLEASLYGVAHLEADLLANRLFGSISNLKRYDDNSSGVDYDYRFLFSNVALVDIDGALGFRGALIAQKLSDAAASTTGGAWIEGRFFGSGAQEVAGLWRSDTIAGRDIWGAFGATSSPVTNWSRFTDLHTYYATASSETAFRATAQGIEAITPASALVRFMNLPLGGFELQTFSTTVRFGAPGSNDPFPLVQSTSPFFPATGAHFLQGQATANGYEVALILAERGTLAYARYGYWSERPVGQPYYAQQFFAGGVPAPAQYNIEVLPAGTTARYSGAAIGTFLDGNDNFHDFAGAISLVLHVNAPPAIGGAVSGTIDQITPRGGATAPPFDMIRFTPSMLIADRFNAIASVEQGGVPIQDFQGSVSGSFYGPDAAEVAGVWTLGGDAGLRSWGAFGASR